MVLPTALNPCVILPKKLERLPNAEDTPEPIELAIPAPKLRTCCPADWIIPPNCLIETESPPTAILKAVGIIENAEDILDAAVDIAPEIPADNDE
jgi:hypothetical protein